MTFRIRRYAMRLLAAAGLGHAVPRQVHYRERPTMRLTSLCVALLLLPVPFGKPRGPVVQLTSGAVEGEINGNVAVFKRIPYAQPPVGPLRWREPHPVVPWAGVRDATKASAPCMQNPAGTDNFIQPLAETYGVAYTLQKLEPSEDCLYLNVWTPLLQAGAPVPVMVWVHGGSNRVGSGSESGYEGTSLASNGVVVVTINYRLGIMGFFVHPELTAESPHHSSGNYGLLDQIAALRWVQENIAQFGGDPGNVTLFGESAGAIDSTLLMTSPLAANLFRRVIAESGPVFGLGPARFADGAARSGHRKTGRRTVWFTTRCSQEDTGAQAGRDREPTDRFDLQRL